MIKCRDSQQIKEYQQGKCKIPAGLREDFRKSIVGRFLERRKQELGPRNVARLDGVKPLKV